MNDKKRVVLSNDLRKILDGSIDDVIERLKILKAQYEVYGYCDISITPNNIFSEIKFPLDKTYAIGLSGCRPLTLSERESLIPEQILQKIIEEDDEV